MTNAPMHRHPGTFPRARSARRTAALVLAAALAAPAGAAPPTPDPDWQAECGSCHIAYPPRFLRAESWAALMAGLSDHFGTDASLDAPVADRVSAWLQSHARTRGQPAAGAPPLRITQTRWFVAEHRRVLEKVQGNPQVGSGANCEACHTRAAEGRFGERDIRVPKAPAP